MTYRRLHATLVALAMCLALTGCMGGDSSEGKRGRTAQRGRLSVGRAKKTEMAKGNRPKGAGNIDDFSPEGSMERDLAQLRKREQAQEKMLTDMRGSLNQGSEHVRREEEKLAEIRRRINNYDTAINRYEMASKSRPPREAVGEPSVVPREMFEDRGPAATPVSYGADDYTFENPYSSTPRREARTLYSVEARPPATNSTVREYRSDGGLASSGRQFEPTAYDYDDNANVEQVLYSAPPADGGFGNRTRVIASSSSLPSTAQKQSANPVDKPFAGATVGRSNNASRQSVEAKMQTQRDDEFRVPDALFSKRAAPSAAQQHRNVAAQTEEERLDQQVRSKAAAANNRQLSAMAAPAQRAGEKAALPKTEVRMQPKQQPTQPAAAKRPLTAAPAQPDEEVFTPDLFLGN